jgi:hypothetical protein
VEWTTDGYVAIIGHDIQEESIHAAKSDEELDLDHTVHVRDGIATHYYMK